MVVSRLACNPVLCSLALALSALRLIINYYWKANVAWPLRAATIDNSCTTGRAPLPAPEEDWFGRKGLLERALALPLSSAATVALVDFPRKRFRTSSHPLPPPPSCIYKLFAVGGTRRAVSRQKIDARETLPKDIDRRFRTTVRSAARWKLGNFGRAPVYSPTTLEPRSLEDEAYVYRGTVRRSDGKFSAACINGRNTKSLSVAENNFAITSDCAVCRIRKAFTILGGNIAYKNFEAIRKEYTTNF